MARDDEIVDRLIDHSRYIGTRIARLDEQIAALDRQLRRNEELLAHVNIEQQYIDNLFSDDEYEHEDYPSSDDESDDSTVVYHDARDDDGYESDMSTASTVVVPWTDPYQTPDRAYHIYYPNHLDEGLEILENL